MTLHQKQVLFAHMLPDLIQKAFDLGFEVTLGEVWRTPEQAQLNAKDGKGIKNSLHLIRLAVDLCLWKDDEYLTKGADYQVLGEWWEKQSGTEYTCCWGGRFNDGNHFSIEHEGVK